VLQQPSKPLLADDFPGRERESWRRIDVVCGQRPVADALVRPLAVDRLLQRQGDDLQHGGLD
jgi:hypothetical protein